MKSLREIIRHTRLVYGLSQKNVADYLGVTRNYISCLENNTGNCGVTDKRLREILDTVYFLGECKKEGNLEKVLEQRKQEIAESKKQF